jgi:S-DNA-T family DNA segregation ATPase FtsK/SpoIIIE
MRRSVRRVLVGFLVFAALTVLVIAYNIDFKLPQRKKRPAANG